MLGLHSPDGDSGSPGALDAEVLFESLAVSNGSPGAGFAYEVRAICDAPTLVNLASYTSFNLGGCAAEATVFEYDLMLHVASYTPCDAAGTPNGVIALVAGTPFDFRKWRRVGAAIGDGRAPPLGLDQNMIIGRPAWNAAARSRAALSYVWRADERRHHLTWHAGVLVWIPWLAMEKFGGICFEPQHFSDSPHHRAFPDAW